MSDPSLRWATNALREQLDPVLPRVSVEVVARAASTNTVLVERARGAHPQESLVGAPALVRRSVESAAFGRSLASMDACLLVAEEQTAGRGRQGRAWHSAAGASLTFSLSLPLQVADWSGLSLAVGVAVADALDPAASTGADAGCVRIGLKWPNDLWLMDSAGVGRKLGGILTETTATEARRVAVIGIGLNVQAMVPGDAGSGFASLRELDATTTAPKALHRVALPLALALREFEREGFAAFAGRFAARDLLYGHAVRTTQPDVPEGVAKGVSAQGALLVQTSSGVQPVYSGEVSVRLKLPALADTSVPAPSC